MTRFFLAPSLLKPLAFRGIVRLVGVGMNPDNERLFRAIAAALFGRGGAFHPAKIPGWPQMMSFPFSPWEKVAR